MVSTKDKEKTLEFIKTINRGRKVTSIYVDADIWQDFKKKCRNIGDSTCSIMEAFMYAFCRGVPDMPHSPLPIVNVNLTVNRVVSKQRRKVYPTKDNYMGSKKNGILHGDGSREDF